MMRKLSFVTALISVMLVAQAAYGAFTVTISKQDVYGSQRVVHGYITFDGESYVTGGITVVPAYYGLSGFTSMSFNYHTGSNYIPALSGSKIVLYESVTGYGSMPAATLSDYDKFKVVHDGTPDGKLVFITTTTGNVPASLGIVDGANAPAGGTDFLLRSVSSMDSLTYFLTLPYDTTSTHPKICYRTYLMNADTLYFSDSTNKLYYSGFCMGDMGDLYLPFGLGRVIEVSYRANPLPASYKPLYFDVSADIDKRFDANLADEDDSYFGASSTLSPLARWRTSTMTQVPSGTLINTVLYFTVVGY